MAYYHNFLRFRDDDYDERDHYDRLVDEKFDPPYRDEED